MSAVRADYAANRYGTKNNIVKKSNAAKMSTGAGTKKQESVVDEFKKKHPKDAAHVDKQVQAGRSVKLKYGAEGISPEDMTMEEYKKYFYALLDTIPYDPTRVNDETVLTITDDGWEQMKKDPDYESWILGYFVEDRSVRNPFFGWGNNSGMFIKEHFGASIEEHHGEGYSKSASKSKSDEDDEESWWSKRHKRMKEVWEEQAAKERTESAAKSEALQREYAFMQYESRRRLHNLLAPESQIKGL